MDEKETRIERIRQMLTKRKEEFEKELSLIQENLRQGSVDGCSTTLDNCTIPSIDGGNRSLIIKQCLLNIDWALKRLEAGVYGFCLHCGNEISGARLQAIPEARWCVTCQRAFV
jgi:DnaK suppressor protein